MFFWFFLSIKYFLVIQLRRRAGQLWTGTDRGRMGLRQPEGSKAVSTLHQDLLQPREEVGGGGVWVEPECFPFSKAVKPYEFRRRIKANKKFPEI